jgi:hypothetical protein
MSNDNKKMRDEGCQSSDDGTYDSQGGSDGGDHSSKSSEGDQSSERKGQASAETLKNETIKRMKVDMEENRFLYIPPRVNIKRFDYLHYVRKKDEGAFTYVAHADYYILLRACARVAQVDTRIMHVGVLSVERRLAWLESRIDHCLHLTPPNVSCEFCTDVALEHVVNDSIGLSDLNI